MIEKIGAVIDDELQKIGCCKLSLPQLQHSSIWHKSGRLSLMEQEIYKADPDLLFAPTAEEEVTRLIAETVSSYKSLPLMVYQIGNKFRREARPKGGLLRLREFVMKDLYTFDRDIQAARLTFNQISKCYDNIFARLGLPVAKCSASTGAMGGLESQEFHLLSPVGQDKLLYCPNCGLFSNQELEQTTSCCSRSLLEKVSGLELGHAFLLGDFYSTKLDAYFTDSDQLRKPMQMGCFGLGVSRILAAMAETCNDDKGLFWPEQMEPFKVSLILDDPKDEAIILKLMSSFKQHEILIDDRLGMTIGRKLRDHWLIGIPKTIVLGSKWTECGLIECHSRKEDAVQLMTMEGLASSLNFKD